MIAGALLLLFVGALLLGLLMADSGKVARWLPAGLVIGIGFAFVVVGLVGLAAAVRA